MNNIIIVSQITHRQLIIIPVASMKFSLHYTLLFSIYETKRKNTRDINSIFVKNIQKLEHIDKHVITVNVKSNYKIIVHLIFIGYLLLRGRKSFDLKLPRMLVLLLQILQWPQLYVVFGSGFNIFVSLPFYTQDQEQYQVQKDKNNIAIFYFICNRKVIILRASHKGDRGKHLSQIRHYKEDNSIEGYHPQKLQTVMHSIVFEKNLSFCYFKYYTLIHRKLPYVIIKISFNQFWFLQSFTMSSINFQNQSIYSYEQQDPNLENQEDGAEFFSVAQTYNERKAKMINQRTMEAMNMLHNFNIKNNPKDPKTTQAKQQKTRKTRNDKQGREFTCGGCNLSYLSYPALYTHIKTKHNGISPQGTVRGKNNNNKRRGRPKNLRVQPSLRHRPEPQPDFPKQYMNLVDKLQISFIQVEDIEFESLKIESRMFGQQTKQLKSNQINPIITLPIIKVLTIYLQNIIRFIGNRKDVLDTIEQISEKLINYTNKNYFKILKEYQLISKFYIRKEIPENEIYCSYQICEYVPVFVSFLFKRLDQQDDRMQIDFLKDFCQWLNQKKLTHIKIIEPEYIQVGINDQ